MTRTPSKPSILIVDDERGSREVLARFLRPEYDVTTAEDGQVGVSSGVSLLLTKDGEYGSTRKA